MIGCCVCVRISPDGSTLTVTGAHTPDSGKYTCVATNSAGEEDRIFNLNVYGQFILFLNTTYIVQMFPNSICLYFVLYLQSLL